MSSLPKACGCVGEVITNIWCVLLPFLFIGMFGGLFWVLGWSIVTM